MLQAAAGQWGVPVPEVKAVNHEVVHLPTGRRLGFGALAETAMQQPVPRVDALRLKSPDAFRYIGKGKVMPVDSLDIATGRARYGADVRLPGMRGWSIPAISACRQAVWENRPCRRWRLRCATRSSRPRAGASASCPSTVNWFRPESPRRGWESASGSGRDEG
jgi:hypothetical protein